MKNLRFSVLPSIAPIPPVPFPPITQQTEIGVRYSVSFSADFDNKNEAIIFAANMIEFITGNK